MINEGGVVPDTRHSVAPGRRGLDRASTCSYRAPAFGTAGSKAGVGVDIQDREWKGDEAVLPRAYDHLELRLR